jgi:PKD repeat protein
MPLLQIDGNETFGSFIATRVIYRDIAREIQPIADFNFSDTKGEAGYEITFNDISKNNPTEWIWTITPNTYTYMWGTNAGSQTVNVRFDSIGVYDVSLKVSNKGGTSERVRNKLINITPAIKNGLNNSSFDQQFKVYPNPVIDKIIVQLQVSTQPTIIEVQSLDGKTVKSIMTYKEQEQIDATSLASGLYLIKLTQGQSQSIKLFSKL